MQAMADLVGKMNEQRTANQHQADIAWVQDTPFADKVDAIEGGHVRLTCVLDSNPGRPPIWMAPQPLPSQVTISGCCPWLELSAEHRPALVCSEVSGQKRTTKPVQASCLLLRFLIADCRNV